MNMQKAFQLGLAAGALLLMLNVSACGGDDDSASSSSDEAITSNDDAVSMGEAAVNARICKSCHGNDLSGSTTPYTGTTATYPPNITPDMDTGLGEWDEDTIVKAILTGVDDEDEQLCPTMPVFNKMGMTDAEAHNIAKYLKSIAAVSKDIPESSCPPVKGGDDSGGGAGAGK